LGFEKKENGNQLPLPTEQNKSLEANNAQGRKKFIQYLRVTFLRTFLHGGTPGWFGGRGTMGTKGQLFSEEKT